jgi:type I restriction enzyme S subunit
MFPKDGENKPEIRFPGFTDAWERRELGEIADIVGGATPSTSNSDYWGGDIDWYAPAEIGEQIFVTGSQKKITELGLQKSSAKILPIGTVLFTSRAGIGNTAILAKTAATNQGFQSIVPHKNRADSYFIFSRTHELKRYGETIGAGSTFIEVSGKQMAKMPILMPKIDEQRKIGSFFVAVDRLITLHQRELKKLQNIKKALLDNMFA